MQKFSGKSFILLVFGFSLFFLSYSNNGLGSANNYWFESFQIDSERLVTDGLSIDSKKPRLGTFTNSVPGERAETQNSLHSSSTVKFEEYISQYGLQIKIFSFLRKIGFDDFVVLKNIVAFLMALVALGLVITIFRDFSARSAVLFYLIFLLSPWVIAFANNLFWISFSLFLPLLISAYFAPYIFSSTKYFFLMLMLIFLALLFKFLSGYEYTSTIIIASTTPLLYHGLKMNVLIRSIILKCVVFFSVSIISFAFAIFIHATSLDQSFSSGLKLIESTANKRLSSYDTDLLFLNTCENDRLCLQKIQALRESHEASHIEVVSKYLVSRHFLPSSYVAFKDNEKEILYHAKEKIIEQNSLLPILNVDKLLLAKASLHLSFLILSNLFLIILIFLCCKNIKQMPTYFLIPLFISFLAPLSWFLIAKPHSFLHYHINYILWYLYFIPFAVVAITETKLIKT